MTEYRRLQAERTAENLQKIIDATQIPANLTDIAVATGLHICNVRSLILRNIEYFKCLGKQRSGGGRMRSFYQAATSDIAQAGRQVIYHNPYSQLMNEPEYIKLQAGRTILSSMTHNARASSKSVRTHVSGSTLS